MSRVAGKWLRLAALAVVAGAMGVQPAAQADEDGPCLIGCETDIMVTDNALSKPKLKVTAGEMIWFELAPGAKNEHHLVIEESGLGFRLNAQNPDMRRDRYIFYMPGSYAYYCKIHGGPGGKGMAGVITAVKAPPTTTTTMMQVSVDGALAALAAASTPPVSSTPSTVPPASAAPDGAAEETFAAAGAVGELALTQAPGSEDSEENSTDALLLIGALGLAGALGLGAGGWSWYNRSSRFHAA